jgi:hypothetical protein
MAATFVRASDYLKEVVATLGSKLDAVLASNLITREAFNAALADDYDAFLAERAKTIDATVSRLTGW